MSPLHVLRLRQHCAIERRLRLASAALLAAFEAVRPAADNQASASVSMRTLAMILDHHAYQRMRDTQ